MSSRVSEFWENTKRIVKLAQQPTRQEIWMQLKITLLGLFVVGGTGFIITLIMSVITGLFPIPAT
ncbi:MAG: protein translocase SEC61 complex subunit gamma [Candidatus Hermodarchaeota archaeon]|jgi:protein translocase SEC61 complex gamma subunit|nr:protein translocase SEC61 complex subunit gamma [Candidatus Hermodarchaeota archaeon]